MPTPPQPPVSHSAEVTLANNQSIHLVSGSAMTVRAHCLSSSSSSCCCQSACPLHAHPGPGRAHTAQGYYNPGSHLVGPGVALLVGALSRHILTLLGSVRGQLCQWAPIALGRHKPTLMCMSDNSIGHHYLLPTPHNRISHLYPPSHSSPPAPSAHSTRSRTCGLLHRLWNVHRKWTTLKNPNLYTKKFTLQHDASLKVSFHTGIAHNQLYIND